MKIKSILAKLGILGILATSMLTESVSALSLNSNGDTINPHMNDRLGDVNIKSVIEGWHYSGGYWKFNYNDFTKSFTVRDRDVPTYFTGTSKNFPGNLLLSYSLPSQVVNFANIYGYDKLGVKFKGGKDGSVYGNSVGFNLSNGSVNLTFKPVMRYDRYNMWEINNPKIWRQYIVKVHTPQVTAGYGANYLSVRNGVIGMEVTPSIMRNAYKHSDGTLRFNTDESALLGDGSTTIARKEMVEDNFFEGGSSGVQFRYPFNIEFYDLGINVNPLTVSSHGYEKDGTYWVKSDTPFNLTASSYASAYDDLVKVNANYFRVVENNTTAYVNARIKENQNSNNDAVGNAAINVISGTNTRDGVTLNSTITASLSGDRDIQIDTFGRLIRFPNPGDGNFDGEMIYKDSPMSNQITIKSDSQAPTASSSKTNYDVSTGGISIKLNKVTDDRSGVKDSNITAVIYPEGDKNSSVTIKLDKDGNNFSTNYVFPSSNDVYGDYKVEYWTEDNVGNRDNVFTDTITRQLPKPTTTTVLIKDYEYEDNDTKWVKANKQFSILQEGYSVVGNPTQSNIRITKSETDIQNPSISNGYSLTNNSYNAWNTNIPDIVRSKETFLTNSTKIESFQKRHYGSADYKFTASSNLNGEKFYVFGATEITVGGIAYTGDYIRDPKMLGIDGKPPILNYEVKDDISKITIEDKESGFSKAEVTIDGVKKTYTDPNITIDKGSDITIVIYDNVGNSATHKIKREGWEGKAIKTWIGEVNNKRVLRYSVDGEINDTVIHPNNTVTYTPHNLRFNSSSSLYIKPEITKEATDIIHYENLVEDKYNQPFGPALRYEKNNSTFAYVRWDHLEDIEDIVDLRLFDNDREWDSVVKHFASGRKDYKWVLYQTKDRYGNSVVKTKVGEGNVATNELNMANFKTGSYEIHVTMYDYNGNPSGTSILEFEHTQPHINTDISDLFLKVTAVKDLNWESMDYPIKYNALEFPIGKNKLSKNGEGIKLGYAINFSIENMIRHNLSDYSISYSLLGENGEDLKGTSNGKNLKDSDRTENSGYLTQNTSHITVAEDPRADSVNNGFTSRLFFKHFIPADTEFYTSDNRPYRGKVTVRAKINLKEIGSDNALGDKNYIVDLYTIDTTGTAYDDLYIDKQR